jgi:hypothetical protein
VSHECVRVRVRVCEDVPPRCCRTGCRGTTPPMSMMKQTHNHTRPPHVTSSTTATRHVYIVNTTVRSLLEPSLLFGPCQIGISLEYAPYQKPRPHSGLDNSDIGPSLLHVSLHRTKPLSRTYLYDFVCDVSRFTQLVTSHCIGHTVPQEIGKNKR